MSNINNDPLIHQRKKLIEIILQNPNVKAALDDPPFSDGTEWYIAGGSIYQTVWNYLLDRPLTAGIEDIDIAYFNLDISKDRELEIQADLCEKYHNLDIRIEAVNQARVHLWHEQDFGYAVSPRISCEDSIKQFPSTVTSVGVTLRGRAVEVFAPFGLDDIFTMTARPNISSGLKGMYEGKLRKWQSKWPGITVHPWVD